MSENVKSIVILFLAFLFFSRCNNHLVPTAAEDAGKDNYIIQARISASALPFNQPFGSLNDRVSISYAERFPGFVTQEQIEFRCYKITRKELNAIVGELLRYCPVMNLNYYKVNE